MQLLLSSIEVGSTPEARIEHQGESVAFNVGYYKRDLSALGSSLFEYLNGFWASLPLERQAQIFECYREIRHSFDRFIRREVLHEELKRLCATLLDLHDLEQIKTWMVLRSSIPIPHNFQEVFVEDIDKQNRETLTYLKRDYFELIALTIALRSMMPVWGEYIGLMRTEHGTLFKEYEAFSLIEQAHLTQSHAFHKLRIYIEDVIDAKRFNKKAIIDGISSEDFPQWVMAQVVVRRLMVANIREANEKANLITFVYSFITQRMNLEKSLEDGVREKSTSDEGSDVENKLSEVERYRLQHSVSLGELAEIEYSISDVYNIAHRLSSQMDDAILARCIDSTRMLLQGGARIDEAQVMLLQWVMKPVVSPRGIVYLDYRSIVNCLAVAQAVLWVRGHKFLSVFISAHPEYREDALLITSSTSRARIPKELVDELDRLYPYQYKVGGKQPTRERNFALQAIDNLVSLMTQRVWIATADDEFLIEALGSNTRRLAIPYDIKVLLAQLVVELGARTYR